MPLLLALLLALSSVTVAAQDKYDVDATKVERLDYLRCNQAAAQTVARLEGDPVSLAIAARGMCINAEIALKKAAIAAHGSQLASKMIDIARKIAADNNTAIIVKERLLRQ